MDLVYAPESAPPTTMPDVAGMPHWRRVPLEGASEEDILQFVRRVCNHEASFRRWRIYQAALNQHFYIGNHHIWPYATLAHDGGGYRFRIDESVPKARRSTTNLIQRAANNEISRIGAHEFVPNVSPARGMPEIEAAARAAKNYLLARLTKNAWESKRADATSCMVIHGTVGMISRWSETNMRLRVESEAVACRGCGAKLGTRRFTEDILAAVEYNRETIQPVPVGPDEAPQVDITHCPVCPHPEPLEDYVPSLAEVQSEKDVFGLPLGLAVPTGESDVEVLPMNRLYPENGGHGVEPHNCKIMGVEMPRSMEWIAEHYEHLINMDEVQLTPATEIFKRDLLLGDDSFSSHYSATGDAGIYDNHALVREVFVEPMHGLPAGRHFVVIGEDVVVDGRLLKEFTPQGIPGAGPRTVPVAKLGIARYGRIPGFFWGDTPFTHGVPIQRRLNRIDTMQEYLRERGVPHLWVPPGTRMKAREDIVGLALRVFEFESQFPGWRPQDALFPGAPLTGNAYEQERQSCINDFRFVFGPSDIEAADVSGLGSAGKTATGLMLLSGEAAKVRGPAEGAIVEMCEPIWTHVLECTWAFHTDEDEYETESATGRRELKAFQSQDLLGQVNVKISQQKNELHSLRIMEGTAKALEFGLYRIDDPAAAEKVLENLDLPRNVNEDRGIQIERAEDAWQAFRRSWEIPVVDDVLHEPQTWLSILGKRWMGDDAKEMQQEHGWKQVQAMFGGWQSKLAQASAQDAAQRQIYEGYPPQQWASIYNQLSLARDAVERAQAAKAQTDIEAAASAPGMPPPLPPEPPPPAIPPPPSTGQFLPEALERRIAFVLERLAGLPPYPDDYDPNDPALPEEEAHLAKLCKMVRMYAVILAYSDLAMARRNMMRGGVAAPAAPGGAADQAMQAPPPRPGADQGSVMPPPQPGVM